eukprot:32822_1
MAATVPTKTSNTWRNIMCGCLDDHVQSFRLDDIHASIPINVSCESIDYTNCIVSNDHDSNPMKITDTIPMQNIGPCITPFIDHKPTHINGVCDAQNDTMIISGFAMQSTQSPQTQNDDTYDLVIILRPLSTPKTLETSQKSRINDDEIDVNSLDDSVSNVSEEEIISNANYSPSVKSETELFGLKPLILDEYTQ